MKYLKGQQCFYSRRQVLKVKNLWKSWGMNKPLQIFAVFAVFQDELEAVMTLKASFYNQ